jgi:hypothetical protein
MLRLQDGYMLPDHEAAMDMEQSRLRILMLRCCRICDMSRGEEAAVSNVICLLIGMVLGMPLPMMMMVLMADLRSTRPPTKEEWKVMSMDE